ncbi:MAG: SUMF1/EgtB/PvdO family nonheme iron enzyme, partial [Planctomycetota bacterium]|nr:SUMF1/EgtB/PvdO family nonheme iron enzyme [Planctomycetota bacterium]
KKAKSKDLPEILQAEMPAHNVTVKAFLIAEHECTVQEWARFMKSKTVGKRNPDIPKANLSWDEIKSSLKSSGEPFRLPSEAEWEYACRATSTTRFYWGDEGLRTHSWSFRNARKHRHSYKEHLKHRNRFGLIDMSGNIAEWCEDSAIRNYNDGPNSEAPRVEPGNPRKVVRGGSFKQGLGIGRSGRRLEKNQDVQSPLIGVRFALSLPKVK